MNASCILNVLNPRGKDAISVHTEISDGIIALRDRQA